MCFRCGLIVGKWFVYAVHTINILVTVMFWKTPWGTLGRLSDLFMEPTADFFLWGRPMDLLGRDKVVHCGIECWV